MTTDMPRGWKTAATKRCQAITANTLPGQPVTGEDAEWLAWLISRHPCASEKIGAGISMFTVQLTQPYKTRGLFAHRVDGTVTDFSWRECITGSDHPKRVKAAMRHAVESQIVQFKMAAGRNGLCDAITGETLTWDNADVDHAPPVFIDLADTYARLFGGYDAIPLTPSLDGQIGRSLAGGHERAWRSFHQRFARLQIVSAQMNRSVLTKLRRKA